jgi:hypothetical protein
MLFRDPESTKKLFEKYKPTHIIHLAALGETILILRIFLALDFASRQSAACSKI